MKHQSCCSAIVIVSAFLSSIASARSDSIWDHNGSEMSLVADGKYRKLYYANPRQALVAQGVTRGTLLFEGRRDGNSYTGKAYLFSSGCPFAAYQVSGEVSSDDRKITLTGRAPIRNKQCNIEGYRDDVLTFAFIEAREAATNSGDCVYKNAVVSCKRLEKPIVNPGLPSIEATLYYRFTKSVPLWPNQALFGPPVKDELVEPEDPQQYYNRKVTGVSSNALIGEKPLRTEPFDATFVDINLARARGQGAMWTKFNSNLVVVENVFRGEEVFQLWSEATSKGVICGNKQTYGERFPFQNCAFARRVSTQNSIVIEYCVFSQNIDSQASPEAPLCIDVASEKNGKRRVVSTWYSLHDVPAGAGGELSIQCELPHQTPATTSATLQSFLETYLGQTSKISKRPNFSKFEASGSKISELEEKLFVRTFLRGEVEQQGEAAKINISTSFTVCAQSSDDITDYREPGEALGNRIKNRFINRLQGFVRKLEPKATCEEGVW